MVAPARAPPAQVHAHGEDTRDTATAKYLGNIHTNEHTLRAAGWALHEFGALGYHHLLEALWAWTYRAQGGGDGLTDVVGTAHFSRGLGALP